MIIEELHIESFGRLQDFSCRPGPGLSVIEGDNESGKSTIAAFIRYMLYGFGRAGGSELAEKKKRLGWQNGRAGGSMVISAAGHRYRLERITTVSTGARERETYRETSAIIDLETNTPLPAGQCPGERFLGVPEQVFLETAFVGQIGSPRPDGDSLSHAIENLLFAGDEHVSLPRALEKLDDLRRTLLHKNGKGGTLYELREREAALSLRLEKAQAQNSACLQSENEWMSTVRAKKEAAEALDQARKAETEAQNILLAHAFDRLHEAEELLARAEAALIDLDGLPSQRLGERDLADLTMAQKTVEEAARRQTEAEADCKARAAASVGEETLALLSRTEEEGGLDQLADHTGAVTRRAHRAGLAAGACLVAALALLVLGLLPAFSGWPLLFVLAGLFLLPAAALGLYALAARRDSRAICLSYGAPDYATLLTRLGDLRRAGEQELALRAEEAAAENRRRVAEGELRRAYGELDTVVRRFHARLPQGDSHAFSEALTARVRNMLDKKKLRQAERAEAAGLVTAFRQRLQGVNEAAVRAALPPGPLPAEDTLAPATLHQRVEQTAARLQILTEQEHTLEKELAAARSRMEDPAVLSAAQEALQEELRTQEARYAAVTLAYEALCGAGERLRREISPRLSAFACRQVGEMTGGRYADVGVGSDLSVLVETESGTRTPEHFSAGTQELIYLSLRMALIDLLYRERPPVCFDESFAHQDDTRLCRAVSVLLDFAGAGQQCFLFSCHGRDAAAVLAADPGATHIRLASL